MEKLQLVSTCLFAGAVLHIFFVKRFQHLAGRYPEGSIPENFFHLVGEVEVVFGLWAAMLVAAVATSQGFAASIAFVESQNFTEPAFVFVIMAISATRPILQLTERCIALVARLIPLNRSLSFFFTSLFLGPLLGSFITEPAAMTVTALLLKRRYFDSIDDDTFRYATLAVLFVNISIGGVLTPYAAPPVLMVAGKWGWDMPYMLSHFGWKAAIAVAINAAVLTAVHARRIRLGREETTETAVAAPWGLVGIHLAFLAVVVMTAHHPVFFLGLFLFFLGVVNVTREYQTEIKLKDSLLVAFFLGGLVVLGSQQGWWIGPLLGRLDEMALFGGSMGLTAFMDNAALTYLGSLVPDLREGLKYALVAGAVAGGGLTVIANAPNPAGFSILRSSFGREGISPIRLLLSAIPPTLVAATCFWWL